MRIDVKAIDDLLKRRKEKDEDRGHQPEMRLGCFRSLETDDTENSVCTACPHYDTCALYLAGYEAKEDSER